MAQLAVSLGGAVIGFAVGGPLGAQVGWMAGSLIGATLFAESQNGPRLSDTKVQVSSYGAAIPLPYGGVRLAGNVIWSTDLQEHASESGGKGGPSTTTFSYSVSCAVAFSGRQIGGIRRIWADAKLVYDAREDATPEVQAASASFAEYMTVYLGTEAQSPDPTIEATEGAGNVEAYRGVAYVVFDGLPLGDYGNRIPSFSFETTDQPLTEIEDEQLEPLKIYPWGGEMPIHSYGDTWFRVQAGAYVATFTDYSAAVTDLMEHPTSGGSQASEYFAFNTSTNGVENVFSESLYVTAATLDDDPQYVYLQHAYVVPDVIANNPNRGDFANWNYGAWGDSMKQAGAFIDDGLWYYSVDNEWQTTPYVTNITASLGGTPINTYVIGPDPEDWGIVLGTPVEYMRAERKPSVPPQTCEPGDPSVLGIAQLPGNESFCLSSSGTVSPNYQYEEYAGTFKQLCAIEYRDGVLYQNALGPVLPLGHADYNNAAFWSAARSAAITAGTMQADVSYPAVVSTVARAVFVGAQAEEGSMLLSQIVADICDRAGLEAADYDVTALTDSVQGYVVARQMPARGALESLRMAYWFDAVDNGEKIVFVKRGGSVSAALTADDLGATEGGDHVPLVVPKRAQESELPAEINVAYSVRDADYQTGTQQARRVTTGSQQIVSAELPIVLTDTKAAEVADVLMVDAWQGRVERSFVTTRKWTDLLPTDVVTVDDGQYEYRGRLIEKSEDGPLIRWTLRDDASAIYSPSVTASPTSGGGGAIRFYGPMFVELMDIPALRDVDDNAGFYAAASGYGTVFNGGVLYKSLDDSSFSALESLNVQATRGYASTVLGDFSGGNTVDESNIVTVVLYHGSLVTISRNQLLNGGGAALLGSEILQFQRATLVAENTYTLSGLLRGRRGTEQHIGTHAADERFILLNESTIYRVLQSLPEIGTAYYRSVAYGTALADATSQTFENTAAALKPLSPVHLVATPAGAGWILTWTRRTRIGGNWADGIDVPLGEASENYRVRVLDADDVVIEEQFVTVETATIGAGVSVEVAQMSASVGAGFPATLTL